MQILNTTKNIFDLPASESEAVCVTTNGMIKKNGCAVMGAGIAKEADTRFHLSGRLADYLKKYGNRTFYMGVYHHERTATPMSIITFPTKHDWRNDSDLDLIRQSAENLVTICNNRRITKCYLIPVGCANGHLDWESQVYPVLEPLLDDRFIIVFRGRQAINDYKDLHDDAITMDKVLQRESIRPDSMDEIHEKTHEEAIEL